MTRKTTLLFAGLLALVLGACGGAAPAGEQIEVTRIVEVEVEVAGETTTFQVVLNALVEIKAHLLIAWGLNLSLTIWVVALNKSRKRLIERYHVYRKAEEMRKDPGRTSSELTMGGDTGSEDR